MRATIALALLTGGLTQLGVTDIAELAYILTAIAGWTYGGRAIPETILRERVRIVPVRIAHANASGTPLS